MGAETPNTNKTSSRNDPAAMARKLAREHGELLAARTVSREIVSARRARSRRRYQFWTAVAAELQARAARKPYNADVGDESLAAHQSEFRSLAAAQ